MMEQEQVEDEMVQVREYYKYMEENIEQKFKNMTTDTMEQIKNKLKRKQDRESKEQNFNLIERERERIVAEMAEHIKMCFHPHCKMTDEIVLVYNLFRGLEPEKQDHLTLIVRPNVQGLPKIESDCSEGSRLNNKMRETHRMIARM